MQWTLAFSIVCNIILFAVAIMYRDEAKFCSKMMYDFKDECSQLRREQYYFRKKIKKVLDDDAN